MNVAVLGDASGSMEVAIKCAATLGSLLSAALKADLVFFNTAPIYPSVTPRSAMDCIKVVEEIRADGGTAMAAALWPYYEQKKKIDLFVLVSDEEENTEYKGYLFARLFKAYREQIHAESKVVLVSFLTPNEKGIIKQRLDEVEISARQFRLDKNRPDTSKFDALLGLVTLETTFSQLRLNEVKSHLDKMEFPRALVDTVFSYGP